MRRSQFIRFIGLLAALSLIAAVACVGTGTPPNGEAIPTPSPGPTPTTEVDPTLPPPTPTPSPRPSTFNPAAFRQLLPRDAIRPIYEPAFVSAREAGLSPRELVIGLDINGESKAYPIGILRFREMVNDVVGGVPVLVTW